MATIPDDYRDLFDRGAVAQIATLLPDGAPHVTPVYVDYDDGHLVFNTVRGRQKERNIRQHPTVGVSIVDPEDPYRYLSVTGEVVDATEEGAVEHVHHIAQKFMGMDEYPYLDQEEGARVIVTIRPDRVRRSDENG